MNSYDPRDESPSAPPVYYYVFDDGKGVGFGSSIPNNASPVDKDFYDKAMEYNEALGQQSHAQSLATVNAQRQALADALADKLGMSADEIAALLR